MPDEPADAPDAPDDERDEREEPRGDGGDRDSPGRSLLDDDDVIVEPNEPA